MGTQSIGGKPQATGLFLRLAMFLGLFLSFGVATAFAGALTVTNTDPVAVVGTNVANFTMSVDIATAADWANGQNFVVTLPANFPTLVVGDADDGSLGVSTNLAGLGAATNCGGLGSVDCAVNGRELTVTITNVLDVDGAATALGDGNDLVITFTTAADAAGTATITYEQDWTAVNANFSTTTAGAIAASGNTTAITTDPQSAVNTVMVLTLSNAAAGATNSTTLNLDIPVDLDIGDTVAFTAPANLDVSGVGAATQTFDVAGGSTFACAAVGQTVTCTSSGNIDVAAGGESANIVIAGIKAAYVSVALSATNLVVTDNDSSGRIAIDDTNLMLDATTIGDLTATNVAPASLIASTRTTHTISFTTTAAIPNLGKIKVTYPAGWDVSELNGRTAGGLSGLDGTWTASVSGQVATFTQTGGTLTEAGAISFTLTNVQTPTSAGASGTYTILTEIAAGDDIETDTAVTADTIVAGANSSSSSSVNLRAVSDIEVSKNEDGNIVITWEDPSDSSTYVEVLRGKGGSAVSGTFYARVNKGVETYTDTDVEVGETVKYILRTTDGVGNYGTLSEEFSLVVTAGDEEIEVVSEEVDETVVEDIAEETEENAAEEAAGEEPVDEETAGTFTDISGHWGAERIVVMAEEGIIKGDPNGEFRPDDSLNRAEAAALLNRVLGLGEPAAPAEKPFSDVEVSTWYAGYVSSLKGLELVNGNPDGTYKPAANINRAEFLHLALNVYYHLADADVKAMIDGVRAETTNPFVDVTGDAYYVSTVRVAHQMEFVEGAECEGGRCFSPAADITRAEATKILYEMFFAVEAEEVIPEVVPEEVVE